MKSLFMHLYSFLDLTLSKIKESNEYLQELENKLESNLENLLKILECLITEKFILYFRSFGQLIDIMDY